MKKYFMGMIALVILLSAFAYNAPVKQSSDMYVFEYTGDYSAGSVADRANWEFVGLNAAPCDNGTDKACRVTVQSSDVDDPLNPTAINSSVTISEGGSGLNRIVTGITGAGNSYSNRSH